MAGFSTRFVDPRPTITIDFTQLRSAGIRSVHMADQMIRQTASRFRRESASFEGANRESLQSRVEESISRSLRRQMQKEGGSASVLFFERDDHLHNAVRGISQMWIVDPLAGSSHLPTTQTYGPPLPIAVSACHLFDGMPDVGIVSFPFYRILFAAMMGESAFFQREKSFLGIPYLGRPVSFKSPSELEEAAHPKGPNSLYGGIGLNPVSLMTESEPNRIPWFSEALARMGDIRTERCIPYGMVQTATGTFDYYIHPAPPLFDVLGAMVIAKSAGCDVLFYAGDRKQESILPLDIARLKAPTNGINPARLPMMIVARTDIQKRIARELKLSPAAENGEGREAE